MRALLLQLILPLVVGLIGLVVALALNLTAGQQIVITMSAFLIPLVIQNSINLRMLAENRKWETKKLRLKSEFDQKLASIQNCFHRLVERGDNVNDLYCKFYLDEINAIKEHILDADEKDELRMDVMHHYVSSVVLSVFDRRDTKVFRDVYIIENHNEIFDTHSLKYFVSIIEKVDRQKIKQMRSLFVFDNLIGDSGSVLEALLGFYVNHPCLDLRIIRRELYTELFHDHKLPEEYIDFGIYGSRLMFRTITYLPTTTGVFTRNTDTIRRYEAFFEACWTSPAATQPNVTNSHPRDLQTVINRVTNN